MDPLTHALTGSLIAEAGFRRRLGARAIWFGAAVGAWPDLDIVARFMGEPVEKMLPHRGITHAWFVLALGAPVLGWLGLRWNRWRAARTAVRPAPDPGGVHGNDNDNDGGGVGLRVWLVWTALAALAWASHILLDLTNSYGTMAGLPFTTERFSFDALPILDLFFTGTLTLAWLLCRFAHRGGRRRGASRWPGALAGMVLLALTLYAVHGVFLRRGVAERARGELADAGVAWRQIAVVPLMATNRLWRILVRDDADRVGMAVYSAHAPRPLDFAWFPTLSDEQRGRIAGDETALWFMDFTHGIFSAKIFPEEGLWVLEDRRHGMLSAPERTVFSLALYFSPTGELARVERLPMQSYVDLPREFRLTWRLWRTGAASAVPIPPPLE